MEWVVPALPTNTPQTAEQAEAGRLRGRTLPPPEILQLTLDPALPAYRPRKDVELTGSFRGEALDVLTVIAQDLNGTVAIVDYNDMHELLEPLSREGQEKEAAAEASKLQRAR